MFGGERSMSGVYEAMTMDYCGRVKEQLPFAKTYVFDRDGSAAAGNN